MAIEGQLKTKGLTRIAIYNKLDTIFNLLVQFIICTPLFINIITALYHNEDLNLHGGFKYFYLGYSVYFVFLMFLFPTGWGFPVPGALLLWFLKEGDVVKILREISEVNPSTFEFNSNYEFGMVMSKGVKAFTWRRFIDAFLNIFRNWHENSRYRHYVLVRTAGAEYEVALCDISEVMPLGSDKLAAMGYKRSEHFDPVEYFGEK